MIDYEFYISVYNGITIDEDEFNILSPRCESVVDNFVSSQIPYWAFDDYEALKGECIFKRAICEEIETIYQANGMQALTGGADSGSVDLINGVPLSGTTQDKILRLLRSNGLTAKGL